ncbi:UDP-N-acetylglucosamine 2-epimerase (non-hydrolysing) [Georgenia soli]|uniref:UDP-N-acetylglucosamine 2-epimerase (Non-hydrolysing) n=1 Tax=Georgenia soli TaxID=638953 RepID=A0A2A9EJD5_9MICO|nr:UDP-N-acetylglucosamine 2-epimerase (non-hydrolyzing) [Georgenia soli]PFG39018.1 UDP-N-acetylglucosamine 2-epimerase (non-hydrolysing) [Georgenia soli]
MKVLTIVGTRPELIRLSRVIARLDSTVDHVLVHTGQNYDPTLRDVFFEDLAIRQPDHVLGVDTSSLGRTLGEILIRTEEVLKTEQPDAVLVLGDTNSSIAAVIAKRMHIPVYHMEAGNRSFDENVPEETNRRLIDHIADFNLVYTEHARRNLLAEGLHSRRIALTGSPMREVLDHYRGKIDTSDALDRFGLEERGYFLVSAHREENVDLRSRLAQLLETLVAIRNEFNMPVFVSTHPRTRKRLGAIEGWTTSEGVTFHEPLGFHDYNRLQLGAACVLSDSGTIAEESTLLGFPAVTLRDSIERPEALDTGGIIMTGLAAGDVVSAVREAMSAPPAPSIGARPTLPEDYAVSNTSERVVRFMLSTAPRHRFWAGLRDRDTSPRTPNPQNEE